MQHRLSTLLLTTMLLSPMLVSPTRLLATLPALLPQPSTVHEIPGKYDLTRDAIRIVISGDDALPEAKLLAAALQPLVGHELTIAKGPFKPGDISVTLLKTPSPEPEGAYTLDVSEAGIALASSSNAGLYYAAVTLQQLLSAETKTVPAVRIIDTPAFPYRGLMLDCSRHFHSVDTVKQFIDLAAQHKLNYFHWHLTDDQGWRLEIKKYPKLTEIGSTRPETITQNPASTKPRDFVSDHTPHSGFYTQAQVRDIVAFAAARHVTVVPEIEMPGHSAAAIAAYPELSSLPSYTASTQPVTVRNRWGIEKHILNPSDQTIAFYQDILTEVMDLFPSPYIHCGGDEVPKDEWNSNPEIQSLIQRAGVKDSHDMQGYFMSKMNTFLNAHHRRMIGWDEILEAPLPPNAGGPIIMSWRGNKGAIAAAKAGYDTINATSANLYFDHYQVPDGIKAWHAGEEPYAIGGNTTLEKTYALDPVPPGLTPEEARHVLGIQGQLWCEYIATPSHLLYMTYPRACALAELAWSNPQGEAKNFPAFYHRLEAHLKRLDAQHIPYRKLDPLTPTTQPTTQPITPPATPPTAPSNH